MKPFISIQSVRAVGVLALVLALPVLSQAQPGPLPCCTNFDDNNLHGYHSCEPGGVILSLTTGGPSGPTDMYLRALDRSSPPASIVCAGPDCLGDWTSIAGSGGALCYDVNMLSDGSVGWSQFHPDVFIEGGGFRARFVVTSPAFITDPEGPNSGWHYICAPIGPGMLPSNSFGHWEMLDAAPATDWNSLIANVTTMYFPVEVTTYSEIVGYDNICLSAPSGFPTVIRHSIFSGTVNGNAVSYTAFAVTDVASLHASVDFSDMDQSEMDGTWRHWTKEEGKWCFEYGVDDGSHFDLVNLCGCNYDVTTEWIEPDGDTLKLVQHVASYMSGDTGVVTITGEWSGTCHPGPNGATVVIDPIHVLWHQVGPNHVQMTYVQHWTVDGQPDSVRVVKDITYAGSAMLPYDEVGTIANIAFQYDPLLQVEHVEYDLALVPAPGAIPTLSEWGAIIFGTLLLASVAFYIWRRRRVVTA